MILLKIFIDSAKLDEIKEAYSLGVVDGVTTNPSLIKAAILDLKTKGEDVDMSSYISKILKVAYGTPVSLEVTGYTYDEMLSQARNLYEKFNPVAENICVKIPINTSHGSKNIDLEGIRVIKKLTDDKIPVNATLIFTPEQALMAAKAGADYVSPFAGRIDDHLRSVNKLTFKKTDYFPAHGLSEGIMDDNGIVSGIDLIEQTADILRTHKYAAQVIAASLRNARQAREAAIVGSDIATLPLPVIKDMLRHPQTAEGIEKFIADVVPEYGDLIK